MYKCIHHLFTEQVLISPAAVAVEFGDRQLTYLELENQSNRLAHHLQQIGVKPDTLVGICVDRSVEMVVGILGILKAGGAYVPLDPNYPAERLIFILTDTQLSIVLTQAHLREHLARSTVQIVDLATEWGESDGAIVNQVTAENLAYVMYTSGSTGSPKGVRVVHRGVVRLVREPNYVRLTSTEVFLQLAPISFDAATFEIWGCLLNGGRLVIPPAGLLAIDDIGRLIQQYGVNILWLTAGLFHAIVDRQIAILQPLRQLLAGGDILSVPHVQRFLDTVPECQLINGYGPTENTTFTCCNLVTLPLVAGASIAIGYPISGTQVYILDEQLQPVGGNLTGELYIGGDGLARDYLDRPDLTTAKFAIISIDGKPERLYKTGDLGRYLPDGKIEFLGRVDNQVKIRGYRVELGEIEKVLAQHPDVGENVVLARPLETGEKQLVAYIVPQSTGGCTSSEIRRFLAQRLPEYMLPSAVVWLTELPLTANGKVDRQQLPAPSRERPQLEQAYIAPQNELERTLTDIWANLLNLDRVGVDDNFFDLGGTSLYVLELISTIEVGMGILNLPVVIIFQYSTVAKLAKYLDSTVNPQLDAHKLKSRAQLQKAAQTRRKKL